VYQKGVAQWVDQAQQVGAAGSDCRRERVQVDVRRHDRCVRPVPEGAKQVASLADANVRAAAATAATKASKGKKG
jgi:hypothetical protein